MSFLLDPLVRLFWKDEKRQAFPMPPIPAYPGASGAITDYYASGEQSLRSPAVWACVMLMSNTISMLPIDVFKSAPNSPDLVAEKIKPDPPFIRNPEPDRRQSEWVQCVVVSLLLRGNAYGLKSYDRDGQVSEVVLLHPDTITPFVDDDGKVKFRIYVKGVPETFTKEKIWHLPGLQIPGSYVGLSPIEYARTTIGLDTASRKFASDYFAGAEMPKAVVTTERPVDQGDAQIVKDRIVAAMRDRGPIVLGGGVKFQPLSIKPEESQFLETQNATIAQIARYFGVPPEMIGASVQHGGSMTYANVEQRSLDFLTFSIQFWLRRIEEGLSDLLPRTKIVRFDTSALVRTDAKTQAEVDNMRIAGKVMTPDEIRAKSLNMPKLTEEQKDLLDLIPIVATPLGGMKGIPPQAAPGLQPDPTKEVDPNGSQGA